MALPRWITAPVGAAATAAGSVYDYATPGKGSSTLTNAGRSISDPNQVYVGGSGYSGLLGGWGDGRSAFQQVQGSSPQQNGGQPQSFQGSGGSGGASVNSGPVSGAGGGSASYDPAVLASYDQAIGNTNSALGRLGNQFNSGNSAIDASYQNALNQLLLGKNQSQQSYNTNKQQAAQNYVGAKNTIGANAGASLSGLQRLLGSRGAGGGSAYNQAVPDEVARQATLQRADVSNTFGQNNQALDTNWQNYQTGYNNSVMDVTNQRDQQRQGLQNNIETNRASLLQMLAQLSGQRAQAAGGNQVGAAQPFLDQANTILDNASRYQVAPINYQTQAYAAPELSSYSTNPMATPTFQGQGLSNDYFSPYLAALIGQKKQVGA